MTNVPCQAAVRKQFFALNRGKGGNRQQFRCPRAPWMESSVATAAHECGGQIGDGTARA